MAGCSWRRDHTVLCLTSSWKNRGSWRNKKKKRRTRQHQKMIWKCHEQCIVRHQLNLSQPLNSKLLPIASPGTCTATNSSYKSCSCKASLLWMDQRKSETESEPEDEEMLSDVPRPAIIPQKDVPNPAETLPSKRKRPTRWDVRPNWV
ncbi:hypothetical protein C2845_PM03G28830 [Panicum miliaceum]|uniref:Uncharacterized protein n=1 Tax=Panicum miliaceum TaxID=4540 RepID=A0A3L6T7W7_PANMI|nr:hypothetical protein C2845_PM03G28830 [Panicum miliaceum]